MSDAQLAHAIKTCENLARNLPEIPRLTIQAADDSIMQAVPPVWTTYHAGISRSEDPDRPGIMLDAGKIEGAVSEDIVRWAQKVFSAAGLRPPVDARSYAYDPGGPYPRRIEEQGSPDYPGNRYPGAGVHVWQLAALAARQRLTELFERATQ
jgi:hypothetical protein